MQIETIQAKILRKLAEMKNKEAYDENLPLKEAFKRQYNVSRTLNDYLLKFPELSNHLLQGSQFLEIGSGNGLAFDEMTNDYGMNGIATNIETNLRTDYVKAIASALPFKNNSFDLVIGIQSITWEANQQKAIQEIIRVLKPNGTAFINLYKFSEITTLWFGNEFWKIEEKEIYQNLFEFKELYYENAEITIRKEKVVEVSELSFNYFITIKKSPPESESSKITSVLNSEIKNSSWKSILLSILLFIIFIFCVKNVVCAQSNDSIKPIQQPPRVFNFFNRTINNSDTAFLNKLFQTRDNNLTEINNTIEKSGFNNSFLSDSIGKLSSAIQGLNTAIESLFANNSSFELKSKLAEVESQIKNLQKLPLIVNNVIKDTIIEQPTDSSIVKHLDTINTSIDSIKSVIHSIRDILTSIENESIKSTSTNDILKLLAICVVSFYLILFLTRLLRYYIKLNRHYKDRKLAIEVFEASNGKIQFQSLGETVMMMSSAHIDFNMPKMPTDVLTQYYSAKSGENKKCCCCCCGCNDCKEEKKDDNQSSE